MGAEVNGVIGAAVDVVVDIIVVSGAWTHRFTLQCIVDMLDSVANIGHTAGT